MALYLVTGGAGFIGSNIADHLVKRGDLVRVLDNFTTGKRKNIAHLLKGENFSLVEGDIRDLEVVKKSVSGCDFVLHQAAVPSVPRSIEDPITSNEVNVGGTLNVLVAARDEGVKRVVFASSSSVYGNQGNPEGTSQRERDKSLDGNQEQTSKKEDLTPEPLSPYAITKLTGEHYCKIFSQIYGLQTVMLRYFNIFGPRQDPLSEYAAVIARFILAMLDGRAPTIFGDGEQRRDFTYIENVVKANLKACEAKGCAGRVVNIGCGRAYSINELAKRINQVLQTEIEPVYDEPRKGDVMYSLADISRAEELLGYRAEVDFFEGLKRSVQWLQKGGVNPDKPEPDSS